MSDSMLKIGNRFLKNIGMSVLGFWRQITVCRHNVGLHYIRLMTNDTQVASRAIDLRRPWMT